MTAQIIGFPRAKKRGPKTRTRSCAVIVDFPSVQRADVWKRWLWLKQFGGEWAVDELGDVDEAVPSCSREGERAERLKRALGDAPHHEVPELEARLRKRSAVKEWLNGLGVDLPQVKDAEDALFYVFDRLSGPRPPSAA